MSNDFLPFAVGGTANVTPQATYAANTSLTQNGFQSGVANSPDLNKVWRQSSIMAAVVAQFIVAQTGQNAVDDGTTATLLANLTAGIKVAATGRLLRTSVYTNVGGTQYVSINGGTPTTTGATTWSPLTTTNAIDFEGQGAGGGGGAAVNTTSTTITIGGAGGAGARGRGYLTSGFSGAQTITITAGGAGGTGGSGGTGAGATSFGSLATFPGGSGGGVGSQFTPPSVVGAASGGTTPTGCNIWAAQGQSGQVGSGFATNAAVSGQGGSSAFGSGGPSVQVNTNGSVGLGYGAGGSGGCCAASNSTGQSGGAGAPGLLIIREYA